MATTLTKTGWFGLTTGKWTTPNSNGGFLIQDTVDGIKIPQGVPTGLIPNTTLNGISLPANKKITLVGDASNKKRSEDTTGILSNGCLIFGNAGASLTGTGYTGITNGFLMLFGDGNNSVVGIGKFNTPISWHSSCTGIRNYGLMQFGNGSNTLTGTGFTPPPITGQVPLYDNNGSAIDNGGSIIFGTGNNTVDALKGGFSGGGYIEFGNGMNTIKGFGDMSIDGGGNANTKLLLDQGTYQITSDGAGSFQITNTGRTDKMDITGIPKFGAAKLPQGATTNQTVSGAAGTMTVDTNGKVTFETGIGNDAYMVYDSTTHLNPISSSYSLSNSFLDHSSVDYDETTSDYIYIRHEVRFASTTAGQTLTLYAADTGVGSVTIGTGTSANAVTTGTISLNVNANLVKQGLTLQGNNGNNKLIGGVGNDRFISSAGSDEINGGSGTNTADYSNCANGITVNVNQGNITVSKGNLGTDTLITIQGIIGSNSSDTITGNGVNNIIAGGMGLDSLDGKGESDAYIFNAGSEHPGAEIRDTGTTGTDIVVFDSSTANDKLTLYAGDTGIEAVNIGSNIPGATTNSNYRNYIWSDGSNHSIPEPGTIGAGGTTALNVDARAVTNGLTITGNDGDNTIFGSKGDNVIYGGNGNDTITGGTRKNMIYGGLGNDTLTGGGLSNTFVFDSKPDGTSNKDTVTNFNSNTDKLQFKVRDRQYQDIFKVNFNYVDEDGTNNTIDPNQFLSATSDLLLQQNSTPSANFLYNTTTGVLYFDQDGIGSNFSAIQVATFANKAALASSNIVIDDSWG